jgi:hypothetical protein
MSNVTVVSPPTLEGKWLTLVLVVDRIGRYPEFRAFFQRTFDLGPIGASTSGYIRTSSGRQYALLFVGRGDEPFPAGIQISAVTDSLESIDETAVDRDLQEMLRWITFRGRRSRARL